jgi:HlyD family secretion protein
MTGTVAFIGEYPVTSQYMFDQLASEELAREFLKRGACYEVYISLAASEETATGYKWTTSQGPNKKFGNLTQCDASIITEELRPIDVFFFGN